MTMPKRLQLAALALGVVFGSGCASEPSEVATEEPGFQAPVDEGGKSDVFGTDDRDEVYSFDDASPLRAATDAVAAMVLRRRLAFDVDGVSLTEAPRTLQDARDLCDDERFLNQPQIASCSGFLVAPDILVTAGHCVDASKGIGCADVAWVFGMGYEDEASAEAGSVPAFSGDDVYSCAQVLATQNVECTADYAVIRLDREVVGRTPLTIEASRPALDDTVYAIGFPSGIPMKVAPGQVKDMSYYTSDHSFEATVDGFGGNSGGPVVDEDGHVRGILVCGNALPEYVPTTDRCWRTSKCDEDGICRGMGVYAIDNITGFLDCRTASPGSDCVDERTTYPKCDAFAPSCPDGLTCQHAARVSAFHCMAGSENSADIGENCYLDTCPSNALCFKQPGMGGSQTDVECRTVCQDSVDCPSGQTCGPRVLGQDYQVCYPR